MQTKKSHWLRFCWNIGRTAFIGGWAIFLGWLISRYFFAEDFIVLELIGFFWLLGFFVVGTFALFLLGAYVFINRRQLHREVLFTTLMLLINFCPETQAQIPNFYPSKHHVHICHRF
jgi:hypothetical protein